MSGSRGGGSKSQRSSTRTIVISKAMRLVDSNTRNEESMRRLRSLESDAYMEELMASMEGVADDADQAYSDDDVGVACCFICIYACVFLNYCYLYWYIIFVAYASRMMGHSNPRRRPGLRLPSVARRRAQHSSPSGTRGSSRRLKGLLRSRDTTATALPPRPPTTYR